ncbi:flagella synthesis protein [Isoalcanivorax pacificus W11-5]|uniref:Flagella synthesis protein n=1 Tax=Isoalcanivorax pacificus W11-5 TaxID=391936 RepID=A0A0B4XM64_9GAMM|nr:flagellar protein FlgN [Isoalcanivorax pacificus]AJD49379.1 flagella synthesis protein [Isoalcanivorax pacificus W11-5]
MNAAAQTPLQRHIAQQQGQLETLSALLQRERTVLQQGEPDSHLLADLAAGKQQLLEDLNLREQRRRAVQQQLGFEDSADGDTEAATRQGCLPGWHAVQALAAEVARQNRLNGLLIDMRLHHNQRMLNFLRDCAREANPESGLYGPDGQARQGSGQISSRV